MGDFNNDGLTDAVVTDPLDRFFFSKISVPARTTGLRLSWMVVGR